MSYIDTHYTIAGGGFCISNDGSKCIVPTISPGPGWTGSISWAGPGSTSVSANWKNPTGQIIFIQKAQGGINFGGTVTHGIANTDGAGVKWTNDPSAAGRAYLKNVADLAFGLSRHSDGLPLVSFGYDHYDNFAQNVREPVDWSAHPIPIGINDSLDLYVGGGNGYFQFIGGSVQAGYNAWAWYTVGEP
jgi:hypothetical protein